MIPHDEANKLESYQKLAAVYVETWHDLKITDVGEGLLQFKFSLEIQQIWGLPFNLINEEAGSNIGRSTGELGKVDSKALKSNQSRFLRIQVEDPLNKPLSSVNGEKPYGEWLKAETRARTMEAGGGQSQTRQNRIVPQAQPQTIDMPTWAEIKRHESEKLVSHNLDKENPVFAEKHSMP
nr:hypothetical protein CFP56_55184 [Quercus suber]